MNNSRLTAGAVITMIVFVAGMVWAYSALLAHEGRIVIQQNYKADYEACLVREEAGLKNCPQVQCRDSPSGIVWVVIGGIFYLGSLAMWFFTNRSLEKKKEKIDEQEKKLKEREERLLDSTGHLKVPVPPKRNVKRMR